MSTNHSLRVAKKNHEDPQSADTPSVTSSD